MRKRFAPSFKSKELENEASAELKVRSVKCKRSCSNGGKIKPVLATSLYLKKSSVTNSVKSPHFSKSENKICVDHVSA